MFLGGQPCHYVCTNASRGLSAIDEFLVTFSVIARAPKVLISNRMRSGFSPSKLTVLRSPQVSRTGNYRQFHKTLL